MKAYAKIVVLFIWMSTAIQSALADTRKYEALADFRVAVGETFPLENLVAPDGQKIAKEHLVGNVVLINFYTENCPPCIREVPKLNQIMKSRSDILVLAITPDSPDEAANYVKKYGFHWPVAANASQLLFERLNVDAFPSFALVDTKGRLVATVYANQLGGDEGHATVEGIDAWLDLHVTNLLTERKKTNNKM